IRSGNTALVTVNGNTVVSLTAPKNVNYVFYSSPEMTSSNSCSVSSSAAAAQNVPVTYSSHEWDNGRVTEEADCTRDGVKTYTCRHCGAEKTESVPAHGHDISGDTCSHCGYTVIRPAGSVPAKYYGDVDKNGSVTATDYLMVKRNVLNTFELDDEQKDRADVNRSGGVEAVDYLMVKRHVLGTYAIPGWEE
ncbi:MAG: hypothetical protein J5793_01050, partial [Clostridia bacterium]|nr:hypothetical protein [Clostridia bacterium]